MTKIKFVVDSVADIPQEQVEQWDITVVPCFVNYGGESYADDGVHLVRKDYYNQLVEMEELPTTAAMPPGVAQEHIEPIMDDAEHLIVVTTPAKLSGIHNSMRLALQNLEIPEDRYTLVDSGSLSLGIAVQVLKAAEVAAETGDVQQTIEAIKQVQQHSRTYATVGSMEFLQRSGRVGWAVARIAGLLNIKPVVKVEGGEVHAEARVRTFNRALNKMASLAGEEAPFDWLGVLHINNPDGAAQLKASLGDVVPDHVITGLIGPTLGTHIGPGSVGVVTLKQGWKRS